ncbi:MAG: ORF6N domain-containing protein [Candidatus Omnitrophota bacterium]|nr:ORF6N domain-containing protein [Candidatus Omnitrophota bacterium]
MSAKPNTSNVLTHNFIAQKIYLIRGQKVMIDHDLAMLYEVNTKQLNQQVKRNRDRFPEDFMFQLTREEADALRSQNVTLNEPDSRSQIVTLKQGQNIKYSPYVFTEQGVAMLSSVLKSKRAVLVNIAIMRAFVKLREIMATHKELRQKIEEMEKKYDGQFGDVFEAIKRLMTYPNEGYKKTKIGFIVTPENKNLAIT